MNQCSNNNDCGCNDYSLLTANTGIAAISTGSSSLAGNGATAVITAAGDNGTIIKSVIIKATMPVTTGMVRLFIASNNLDAVSLYKEIPIPNTPALASVSVPLPMLLTYEVNLCGGLKLTDGYQLLASTQNSESFNVIAQGLDVAYPGTIPDTCCNFKQETAITGLGTVSTANGNLDGSGTIVNVFTAGSANGATIKSITIKALQSTNEGIIRLFIGPSSSAYSLMKEIYIPQTTQSGFEPSFKVVLEENMYIQSSYVIGASTQVGQHFAITVEGADWSYPIS